MKIITGCRGFTLVEIMVVLAVMGLLLLIATPDQNEATSHNEKALAKAFLLKVSAYQGDYFHQHREYALSLKSLGLTPSEGLKVQYNFQLDKFYEPNRLTGYSIKATPINSVDSKALWLNHLGETSVTWNE